MKNCFQFPTVKLIFLAFTILSASKNTKAQQIAFPGAEGYGKYATGGRGGKGCDCNQFTGRRARQPSPGALAAYPNEPLTVVFQVSGIIELNSPLYT